MRSLGAVFVIVILGASASASAKPASSCGPTKAHTLASDRVARVYEQADLVYGCSKVTGRITRLGDAKTCIATSRVGPIRLNGALVAYGLETCGVDTGYSQIVVRRLSDAHVLHDDAATTRPLPAESYQSVTSLVLKGDGAVAWIAVGQSIVGHGARDVEVHRDDVRGQSLLDHGNAIAPGSLRLHGSTLTWKHGRETRSTSLY